MTVYVDDMQANYGQMKMCHMIADSEEELKAMAKKIGINLKWHQHPNTPNSHFDICLSKRNKAIELGAVKTTQFKISLMTMHRRLTGHLGGLNLTIHDIRKLMDLKKQIETTVSYQKA